MQKIVYILQQVDPNAKLWATKQYSSVTSTELKQEIKHKQERGLFDYIRKLGVIRESIFGVDIQTIATEIAKLRCFLSLIVEETVEDDEPNRGIQPLPNLDFKFITANTLVRLENVTEQSRQMSLLENQAHIDELKRIRDEYFTADPDERSELKAEFKDVQRVMFQTTISNYAKSASNRYKLLSEWNPFENESTTWFDPEWMFGMRCFDIVIANPPYIHLEHIKEQSAYYKTLKYSTYEARGDIYALFYEKGIQLLKDSGFLCYITSNKWMRAAYGKSLRRFFANLTNPIQLIDFAGQQVFDATVDTNIILLSKTENQQATNAVIIKDKESIRNMSVYVKRNSVTIPYTTSDSWTILSPIELSIKQKIEAIGTPLKEWNVKINRGILTGCNDAFIISGEKRNELLLNCKTDCERKATAEIIRPILRGRDIKRYGYEWANQYIIALFPSLNYNIDVYPAVKDYLLSAEWSDEVPRGHGKARLEQTGAEHIINGIKFKARKLTGNKWFETQDPIGYWDDFSKQKIIWLELVDRPNFALDKSGFFLNNTSYFINGKYIYFLLAYLNSSLCDWQFGNICATSGAGTRRWIRQYIEQICVPIPNEKQNQEMKILIDKINNVDVNIRIQLMSEIDEKIYSLFNFSNVERKYIENDNFEALSR